MKVLICSINSKYIHSSLAPWYLKAAAGQAGVSASIEVVETNINQDPDLIINKLAKAKPDVLAFCCHIWNITLVKGILGQIRTVLPKARIILGGPEVSFNAKEIMTAFAAVDYVICGEGEVPFSELLLAIEAKQEAEEAEEAEEADKGPLGAKQDDLAAIAGLCYRAGDQVVCNPVAEPLEQPPNPYNDEYFEQLKGRIAYFEASRGCPFSCTFCLSGRKGNVRFFDLEQVKENLLRLAGSGTHTIKFVDRTFNCHKGRTKEIIRFILAEAMAGPKAKIPAGVCFHFEVGADLFDQETIALLNQAPVGLFQLEAGLQSFNPETLAAIDRHTNIELLKNNLAQLQTPGNIHMHIDLIAGLPYEDMESFGRSFDQAYCLGPQMLQLGFLKMLYGSRLRLQAEDLGYTYSQEPPYEFIANPWLTEAEKEKLKWCEDALERLANSGRFARSLPYVLEASAMRPFHFFCSFGQAVGISVGMPLDDYTTRFYEYACGLPGVNQAILRDNLVCDRLSCDNTGSLPACLKNHDPRYKLAARALARQQGYKKQPFRLYAFALLYAGPEVEVAVADYRHKDPVTGCYPVEVVNYEELVKNL